jgi:large subunit ribosomal protein L22
MNARAQAKHVRQSPYKVRRVLDLVRGLPVDEARVVLEFTDRRAAGTIIKVLDSAVANAEHNFALDAEELFVSEAYADEGPTLKRWRPRARGRATKIRKRTSHITIVVAETEEVA